MTKIEQMVGRKRIDAGMYWGRPLQLIDGCTEVKGGCLHCWERSRTARFMGDCGLVKNGRWTGKIVLNKDRLKLLRRKKPTMWAVWNDLFHEKIPFEFIDDVFMAAYNHPQHILLVLTKHIDRAVEFWKIATKYHRVPPNVWPGVSISTQKDADETIPILLQIPAAVRFVSFEPLLENIEISPDPQWYKDDEFDGSRRPRYGFNWAIIGCESGPKRRECKLEDVRNLINQLQIAGIPPFVKQLSINGKVSHNPEEWPEDLRMRQWPSDVLNVKT